MTRRSDDDEERRREAERVLGRVAAETEAPGGSTFSRTAGRIGRHFAAADKEDRDAAEVWGTRIGRALALGFVVVLLFGLVATYL